MVTPEMVKDLRARTGAGMADCKKALDENKGDMTAAVDWLRAKGIASAAKKAGRVAAEGIVGQYVHAGGRIAVIVEVNCETDFVALNEEFKELVRDVAMHIASERPIYVTKEEVPAADFEAEKKVQIARAMEEGKPQAIAEKMVDGRMRKWFEEVCLLEQKFIKDDSKTVGELVASLSGKIGEAIRVRRFARFEVGEGLEKRSADFAAEVAAMTQ